MHPVRLAIIGAISASTFLANGHRAGAQSAFEGTVTSTFTMDSTPQSMVYSVKGHQARLEASDASGTLIMIEIVDPVADKIYTLIPSDKQYHVRAYSDTTDQHRFDHATTTRTARTDRIAGHACTYWHIVNPGVSDGEMCVASDMGSYIATSLADQAVLNRVGNGGHAFVLKAKDTVDSMVVTTVVTKIEPKSLPASLFTVPAGYTKSER